jgi:hypothetical protein
MLFELLLLLLILLDFIACLELLFLDFF